MRILDLFSEDNTFNNDINHFDKKINPSEGFVDKIFKKVLNKKTPTVDSLAEKYHTSIVAIELELKRGVKHEMEHTSHYKVAKEIALDHLKDDLFYYKKLDKIEKSKHKE